MISYLKLLNFEINRFIKVYGALALMVLVSQFLGVYFLSKDYLKLSKVVIFEDGLSEAAFLDMYGKFSFVEIIGSSWFMGPILLSIAGLILYVFIIWYRDWFGKNTFIYRLLMLPTKRLNLFLAKASAILLLVLGLVAFQLALMFVEIKLMQAIIPSKFLINFDLHIIINQSQYLQIIIPQTFLEFVLYYGLGMVAVLVVFTAIIFERSYQFKGLFIGLVYALLAAIILFIPITLYESPDSFFYINEIILMEIGLGILLIGISTLVSNYLLENKVTV